MVSVATLLSYYADPTPTISIARGPDRYRVFWSAAGAAEGS